jgi:replicative DNA helicase
VEHRTAEEYQEIGTSLKEIWQDIQPAEKFILGLMLENQDVIPRVKEHIRADDFNHPSLKMAADLLYLMHAQGEKISPELLMNRIKDQQSCAIVSRVLAESEVILDRDKCLKDCINWMKKRRLKGKLAQLQGRIKAAQSSGEDKELQKLIFEYDQLLKAEV